MRAFLPLALIFATTYVTGCITPTQTIVYFDADPALAEGATQLAIVVSELNGEVVFESEANVDSGALPVPVYLNPLAGDPERRARLRAELRDGEGRILGRQTVIVVFERHRLRVIRVSFDAACRSLIDCGGQGTCKDGACVPACYALSPPQGDNLSMAEACPGECEGAGEGERCSGDAEPGACWGGSCCEGCWLEETEADEPARCVRDAILSQLCGSGGRRCEDCSENEVCGSLGCEDRASATPPDLSLAANHSCAVRGDKVWCWGADGVALRVASAGSVLTPACVRDDAGTARRAGWFGTGAECSCYASYVGDLIDCWGRPECGFPTMVERLGAPILSLSLGDRHVCALTHADRLFCWGSADDDRLGGVPDASGLVEPFAGILVAQAVAHGSHTCAITGDGIVRCFGRSENGAGGSQGGVPSEVELPGRAISLATGAAGTCAIVQEGVEEGDDGRLFCWGELLLEAGGLRPVADAVIDPSSPVELAGGPFEPAPRGTQIAIGDRHVCAIRNDGEVLCAGSNEHGQLGRPSGEPEPELTRIDQPGTVFRSLAAGAEHTCGARDDGTIWCWGDGSLGQLGHGSVAAAGRPTRVRDFDEATCGAP